MKKSSSVQLETKTMNDIWPAGKGEAYLYTDSPAEAASLKKDFPRYSTYHRNGHIIAWQFLIPRQLITILLRRLGNLASQEKKAA